MSPLVSDQLRLPTTPLPAASTATPAAHPTDSSRMLLGLLNLSRRAAIADHRQDSLEGVVTGDMLRSLLAALHARDAKTVRHGRRVAQLAVGLAEHLGWEGRQLRQMEVAGLLHDIGKIGIPDSVLFKPARLSPDEADLLALHHRICIDLLQACRIDEETLEIVSLSREFFNASASAVSPRGGVTQLGARILSVADAYDSLRTDQPYRQGKRHDEVLRILKDHAGTQFDGNVVNAFARWTTSEAVLFELESQADFDELAPVPPPVGDFLESQELAHICAYLYLVENLYDGFYLVDSDLKFVVWNQGAAELLGYHPGDLLGRGWSSRQLAFADDPSHPLTEAACPLHRVLSEGQAISARHRIKHAQGHWIEVETLSAPVRDQHGNVHGVVEMFRDVQRTGRQPQEYRDLRLAASRDPLTSVANRGELEAQLTALLARTAHGAETQPFSIIFADVDHFKSVNDLFGHGVGDEVLIEFARLLQHETYSGELVGRYGGEEFVVLCPATSLDQAVARAERIRASTSRMKLASLGAHQLTASFGVSQYEPGDNMASLLYRADMALYAAKNGGRNRTHHYSTSSLLAQEEADASQEDIPTETLQRASFFACAAADMMIFKLHGFILEHSAEILQVEAGRITLRVGRSGWFSRWGKQEARQPVEVELQIQSDSAAVPPSMKHRAAAQTLVTATVRPQGDFGKIEAFQNRARRVLKQLASHFASEIRST